jgi:metal-responsive CopG/Arc/MetJ family transcriptional regulator
MTTARKLKVSVTLSGDLVDLVDRAAARKQGTRSGVIEEWLRRAAIAGNEKDLESATTAYYLSLRADQRSEDEAIARSMSTAARRVSYDRDASPARLRRVRS